MNRKILKTTEKIWKMALLAVFASLIFFSFAQASHWLGHIGPCPEGYVEVPNGACAPTYTFPVDSTGVVIPEGGVQESTVVDDTKYQFLAPFSDQYKIFDADEGTCPFGRYANMMVTIFLGIAAVLAMIMIILGGIQWMTSELISSKEEGRSRIVHAVLGLLLALAAYLILSEINPNLLNLCFRAEPVKISILSVDEPHEPVNGQYCSHPSYKADAPWDGTVASLPAETKEPIPAGVSVKPAECTKVGQSGCTTVRGLDIAIVENIVNKCPACKGSVVITEGTGCWKHKRGTSHKPGSPTVDLRDDFAVLNNYITASNKPPINWKWYPRHGVNYLKEPDHWHAQQ